MPSPVRRIENFWTYGRESITLHGEGTTSCWGRSKTMTARLEVDGTDVPLSVVWVHAQTDPYPGGHRYRLLVPITVADEWLRRMEIQQSDLGDCGIWFQSLVGDFARDARCSLPLACVLNTVENIQTTDEYLEVTGVCSPFVRHS